MIDVEMFSNYPQSSDYIPNNRPKPFKPMKLEIMTGESTVHSFEVPFDVIRCTYNVEVIYKLGIKDVLIKSLEDHDLQVEVINDTSLITCPISAEETRLFSDTVLSTHVQLKFTMIDRSIQMSEIYPVKVRNSLEKNDKPTPPPGSLGGIGYTED